MKIDLDSGVMDGFKELPKENRISYRIRMTLGLKDCASNKRKLTVSWEKEKTDEGGDKKPQQYGYDARRKNDMRDPERIDPLLEKLGEAWKKCPDMRFGQFMDNFFSVCEQNTFNAEDDVWEVALDAFIRGERPADAIKKYIETQRTK